jgi:pimeloyl-ACP methyl ester carboxylesterase
MMQRNDPVMHRVVVDGSEVDCVDQGTGEPLLLVHAGVFSAWFAPLADSPSLDGFRVLRVRRAGYDDAPPAGHVTLADHARHVAVLAEQLGLSRLHWVGHSSSCLIGLQLAVERPELIHSLILLEPAPGGALTVPAFEELKAGVAVLRTLDTPTAFDGFMRAVGGDDYRAVVEAQLGPAGVEQAMRESAYFFADEVPAVWEWPFSAADAQQVRQPMLLVEGGESYRLGPMNRQIIEQTMALFPHAEYALMDGVNHLLPLQAPDAVGELIAAFARRHPIAGAIRASSAAAYDAPGSLRRAY